MLPKRSDWRSAEFDEAKKRIKIEFGLSNRQFSEALDTIQRHRGMRLVIGLNTDLTFISDEKLVEFVTMWIELHAGARPKSGDEITFPQDLGDPEFRREMREYAAARIAAIEKAEENFTAFELLDIDEVFQNGRSGELVEVYDDATSNLNPFLDTEMNKRQKADYLLGKTNLRDDIVNGLNSLGRPDLADQISRC